MVLFITWPFIQLFFSAMQARKMSFTIFQKAKTLFQAIKTRSSKTQKIDIFAKRVNPWYWSKNGHFSDFSSQAIQARKMSSTIFQNEKTPFQAIKTRSSKRRKIGVFQRGYPMVLVQTWPFFQLFFFLGNIGQENVFYDSLERKNAFLGYKNKKFKRSKN